MYRFVRFWLGFRIRKFKAVFTLLGADFSPEAAQEEAERTLIDVENYLRKVGVKNGWLPEGYDETKPIFGKDGLLNDMGNN